MIFGGLERTYILHVPPGRRAQELIPLVIVLHGHGGTGKGMITLTKSEFDTLADRDGAAIAYPDGIDNSWNDGRAIRGKTKVDDVGFITALIDTLERNFSIDPHRIYATGMSNGAMMTYRLGCERSDRLAAIAPVDGAIPEEVAPRCSPSMSLPVLVINGTDDPLVHWEGGDVTGPFGRRTMARVLSVQKSVRFWVARNECSLTPVVAHESDLDPSDGTRIRREYYGMGRDGAEVVLYAVEGGGHTWPGGKQYLPAFVIGKTSRDMDACRVIWEFFMKHHR
jgi:polyhydroxybutyrate depolymerase